MPLTIQQPTAGRDYRLHALLLGAGFAAALLVLVGRLYVLQIARGEDYLSRSQENYVKQIRVPADRGMLLDRRGRILADNRPSYDVSITPAWCARCREEIIPRLGTFLSLSADEVSRVVQAHRKAAKLERFRPLPVKIDITRDELDRLNVHRGDDGVDVVATPHRYYRQGPLFAHTLGYMSEVMPEELTGDYQLGDFIGRNGVERRFEVYLRGKDGLELVAVDAKGNEIPGAAEFLTGAGANGRKVVREAVPGFNAVLSLDLRLQEAADRAFPGRAGAVVAMDPNTGFLLAALSKPAYDPNKLTGRITRAELKALRDDELTPMIFRPTQNHYHPGSTYKPVTALAGLEASVIRTETPAVCTGVYAFGGRTWRCHKDTGHGRVVLHGAIARSCDFFFYRVGELAGIDALAGVARSLGFGAPTGLGLDYEVPGIVPSVEYHQKASPEGYQKGFALNTAIGQGDANVTPLQMAVAYAAIANGGRVYRPQMVRRVEDVQGQPLKVFDPELVRQVTFKPSHLKAVVDGLIAVVNEAGGTAYGKRLKQVTVAGKTGTAQVIRLGEERLEEEELEYAQRDHAWFAAFAPAEAPEIVVVVLNEHAGHGSSAAAPAAVEVIKAWFQIKADEEAARKEAPVPAEPAPPPSSPLPPGQAPPLPNRPT